MDATKVLCGSLKHNHEPGNTCRTTERKVLRARVKKKAADDISARPSKLYLAF